MKIAIAGLKTAHVKRVFAKHFSIVANKPDVVVSYGGGGTMLYFERIYSGSPKLAIRNSSKCGICKSKKTKSIHKASEKIYCDSAIEEIIKRLKQKAFK